MPIQGGVIQHGQASMANMPQAAAANPAGQVQAQPAAGPGIGGAATAETAQAQLPGAQQAAGMAPGSVPGGGGAPMDPAMAGGAPVDPTGGQGGMGAPPPPQPGFIPNSQGSVMYTPGQGPINEQVPELGDMGIMSAEPRGSQGMPMDGANMASQMELQASAIGGLLGSTSTLRERLGAEFASRLTSMKTAMPVRSFNPAGFGGLVGGALILQPRPADKLTGSPVSLLKLAKAPDPKWLRHDAAGNPEIKASCGDEYAHKLQKLKERRDPDGISTQPFDKAANYKAPISSHGVPMTSVEGNMQLSTAGEGDVSGLKVAPWSVNGADAWGDIHRRSGTKGAKGHTSVGPMADKVASADPKHVFAISKFAEGFINQCILDGLTDEQIIKKAHTVSKLSEKVAEELAPLTKEAINPLAAGSWLARQGGKALGVGKGLFGVGGSQATKGLAGLAARNGFSNTGKALASPVGQSALGGVGGYGAGYGGATASNYLAGTEIDPHAAGLAIGAGAAGWKGTRAGIGTRGLNEFARPGNSIWQGVTRNPNLRHPLGRALFGGSVGGGADAIEYGMTGETDGRWAMLGTGLGAGAGLLRTPLARSMTSSGGMARGLLGRVNQLSRPAYGPPFTNRATMAATPGKAQVWNQAAEGAENTINVHNRFMRRMNQAKKGLTVAELAGGIGMAGSSHGAKQVMDRIVNPETGQIRPEAMDIMLNQGMEKIPEGTKQYLKQNGVMDESGHLDVNKFQEFQVKNIEQAQAAEEAIKGNKEVTNFLTAEGAINDQGDIDYDKAIPILGEKLKQYGSMMGDGGGMLGQAMQWFTSLSGPAQLVMGVSLLALLGGMMGGNSSMGLLGAAGLAAGGTNFFGQGENIMSLLGMNGQKTPQQELQQQSYLPPSDRGAPAEQPLVNEHSSPSSMPPQQPWVNEHSSPRAYGRG